MERSKAKIDRSEEEIAHRENYLRQHSDIQQQLNRVTHLPYKNALIESSLDCEQQTNVKMRELKDIERVDNLKEMLMYKGEETIPIPTLPITEMKIINTATNDVEGVRYGLEGSITNHRLILLDKNESRIPKIKEIQRPQGTAKPAGITSEHEVKHEIYSNITYFPVVFTDILGITFDVNSSGWARQKLNLKNFIPYGIGLGILSLIFIILAFILPSWFLGVLGGIGLLIAIWLLMRKQVIKGPIMSNKLQNKIVNLAIINPENKRIAKLQLEIPLEFPIIDLITWVKELQFRCPTLQHTSEIGKSVVVNLK